MLFPSCEVALVSFLGYTLAAPRNTSALMHGIFHVLQHVPWYISVKRKKREPALWRGYKNIHIWKGPLEKHFPGGGGIIISQNVAAKEGMQQRYHPISVATYEQWHRRSRSQNMQLRMPTYLLSVQLDHQLDNFKLLLLWERIRKGRDIQRWCYMRIFDPVKFDPPQNTRNAVFWEKEEGEKSKSPSYNLVTALPTVHP